MPSKRLRHLSYCSRPDKQKINYDAKNGDLLWKVRKSLSAMVQAAKAAQAIPMFQQL